MSRRRPATEAELLEITGVGEVKLQRYGAEFLDAIALA
jgi:superfamily II DNA helicase RecQ